MLDRYGWQLHHLYYSNPSESKIHIISSYVSYVWGVWPAPRHCIALPFIREFGCSFFPLYLSLTSPSNQCPHPFTLSTIALTHSLLYSPTSTRDVLVIQTTRVAMGTLVRARKRKLCMKRPLSVCNGGTRRCSGRGAAVSKHSEQLETPLALMLPATPSSISL